MICTACPERAGFCYNDKPAKECDNIIMAAVKRNTITELSEQDREYAGTFAEGIDIADRTQVLQYGSAAQKKTAQFSESSLFSVPVNDLNETAVLIRELNGKLDEFRKAFAAAGNITIDDTDAISRFKTMYDRFSSAMTETARRLEIERGALLRHIRRMEELREKCRLIVREYDLYIWAGRKHLEECRNTVLPEMAAKAAASGMMENSVRTEDYRSACVLFEKKLDDLAVSRMLPVQMMTQLQLIQNSDAVMAESLLKLYTDHFALYRSRVVLSLGLPQNSRAKIIDPSVFEEACRDLEKAMKAVIQLSSDSIKNQQEGMRMFTDRKKKKE